MLAVTGATGFVGSALLAAAAARGIAVRALTRRPQPPRPGVRWVEGALADAPMLARLVEGASAVVHLAALTTARTRAELDRANVEGTRAILAAADTAQVRRFVQISSLAAREPRLSFYGASKAAADLLVSASRLDWIIVRPPAVYGPGDRELLPIFQMVARGVVTLPARGRFSTIEVGDLAGILLDLAAAGQAIPGRGTEEEALDGPGAGAGAGAGAGDERLACLSRRTLEVDDGTPGGYTHRLFARLVGQALERRPLILPVAPPVMRAAAAIDETLSGLLGRRPRLTRDRARYLAHPDWVADGRLLARFGPPRTALADGLARTVAWYRAEGWL